MASIPLSEVEMKMADIDKSQSMFAKCRQCIDSNSRICLNNSDGIYLMVVNSNNHIATVMQTCKKEKYKRKLAKLEKMFASSRIPLCYKGKTLDDYTEDENNMIAVGIAKMMIDGDVNGMFISGDVGTGKTYLASIIAQERMKKGDTVVFASVPELLSDLKASFDNNTSINDMIKNLIECDLLVMDDIGSEYITQWASEQLFLIINGRVNNNKAMLLTSNYKTETLSDRLVPRDKYGRAIDSMQGARLVSRIGKICNTVTMHGFDRRIMTYAVG